MRNTTLFTFLVFVITAMLNCANEPDVILGGGECDVTINGWVEPGEESIRVYLLSNKDTVGVTQTTSPAGGFVFKGLQSGIYTLIAVHNGRCSQQQIRVDRSIEMVHLQFSTIRVPQGLSAPLGPQYADSDTSVSLLLVLDGAEIVHESIRISPQRMHDNAVPVYNYRGRSTCTVFMNADTLFTLSSCTVSYKYRLNDQCESDSVSTAKLVLPIDTTGMDSMLTTFLIRWLGFYGINTSALERWSIHDSTVIMGVEDDPAVIFTRPVDKKSVEGSISATPPLPADYFWSGDTLRIIPANRLISDTTYHVTIDPQVRPFRAPLEFTIRTEGDRSSFFRRYWPVDHTLEVPLNLPFEFESHYSLEPELLQNAFTIEPSVDSLRFVSSAPGAVKVYHAPLEHETTYRISIDENCRSRKGTVLGEPVTIEFTTESDL